MENSELQPTENNQVAPIKETQSNHSIEIYNGASTIQIEKADQEMLCAPFDDLQYEIRPDGYLYVPQALIRGRFNSRIGIGQWAIVLLRDWFEPISEQANKLYYDGAILIRGKFASRSIGEATYYTNNRNQSWASALESGKSDCMVRCAKDLGIALEVYDPGFVRRWQKEYAKRVWVQEKQEKKVLWRRKDVDPFPNETGDWIARTSVPQPEQKKPAANPVTDQWKEELAKCSKPDELISLYNKNKKVVDEWLELKEAFKAREIEVKKKP
jgi:hypothetical protein